MRDRTIVWAAIPFTMMSALIIYLLLSLFTGSDLLSLNMVYFLIAGQLLGTVIAILLNKWYSQEN